MKIIQLKNYTMTQMTGFIIVTDSNDIIAVDGGTPGDTEGFLARLKNVCEELGRESEVDLWLITHPHDDHYSVFTEISKRKRAGQDMPEIGCVMYYPQPDSFGEYEKIFAGQIKQLNEEMAVTPYNKKR